MKKITPFLFLILALIGACKINNPNLPEWDIDLSVPLVNQHYYMRDLVDGVNIIADSTDAVYLRTEGDIDTPPITAIQVNLNLPSQEVPILSGTSTTGDLSLLDTESNNRISFGVIYTGILKSVYTGGSSNSESITISFNDLRRADGTTFSIDIDTSQQDMYHTLDGCLIGMFNAGNLMDILSFTVTAESSLPQNAFLGTVQLEVVNALQFSVFQGLLPDFEIGLQETAAHIDVEYPMGLENAVQLIEADILMVLENSIGFECEFQGYLYAKSENTGVEKTIPIIRENGTYYTVAPANGDMPSVTNIQFSNGVEEILAIMPNIIEIRDAKFIIRSNSITDIGTIKSGDAIIGTYTVNAPFRFILKNERIIVQEVNELKISQENQNRIRNNALSAGLNVKMVNKFPFGATAQLYFGTDPNLDVDLSSTYSFKKVVSFDAYNPNLSDHDQEFELDLNTDELLVFANPKAYMRWAFTFDATDGDISITASPADYIHLQTMIRAKILIAEDK